MDKDWIKAVTLLCIIAQNNADSMKRSVRYAEIRKGNTDWMPKNFSGFMTAGFAVVRFRKIPD